MSVVDLTVAIERDAVVGFLGYPPGREPPPRIGRLLAEVLPEARALARARGTTMPLDAARSVEIGLEPEVASGLVIGLCTAGPGIEGRARTLAAEGDATRALLFDAAGSAAAEEAADLLGASVCGASLPEEHSALECRLSPGYGRWTLEWQRALFALLPHREVGVELLGSLLMVPRKSISFAMWLGAKTLPAKGLAGCARCTLTHCRYRRAAVAQEEHLR
ncbi:MAG: hypothetical protein HYY06_11765 [Deltaproteobacteria bacterium]|nr:hypothetical protein [Deltaproteobacteria bacterium]